MAKVPFDVDSYTARLIGRENVSKVEGAIIELVKNSYDADAKNCILYFDDISNSIILFDDGSGMNKEIIVDNWMTIGRSSKKEKYVSQQGRVQTGAKGIGRFALDRIASNVYMHTISNENSVEWIIDWEDFQSNKKLSETYAEINDINSSFDTTFKNLSTHKNVAFRKKMKELYNTTGTFFHLTKLRDEWDEKMIKRIHKSLSMMIPPTMEDIFKIYLFTNNSLVKDAKIVSYHEDSYDYKVDFSVNESNKLNIKIFRNEFDFRGKLDSVLVEGGFKKEDREYFNNKPIIINKPLEELVDEKFQEEVKSIGDFKGVLYFFKNSSNKVAAQKYYYKDFMSRKNISAKFGGVKLYRDNFWIRPYGEFDTSNYDWLLLSNRKDASPAAVASSDGRWRVASGQIYGQVYISRMNINLEDQSNREGIVETKEFSAFKEVLRMIIKEFETDRQYVFRKLRELFEKNNEAERLERELKEKIKQFEQKERESESNKSEKGNVKENKSPSSPDIADFVPISEIRPVVAKKESEIEVLTNEVKMLRAMATTGIAINTYFHEISSLINDIHEELYDIQEFVEDKDLPSIKIAAEKAYQYKPRFEQWYDVTIKSVKSDKRKRLTWEINQIVEELCNSWNGSLGRDRAEIMFKDCNEDIRYRCYPFEIESVISNLISNSLSAFDEKNQMSNRKIQVELRKLNKGFKIVYSDKGPGLPKKFQKNPRDILIPLETGKTEGTGLGMWIIDSIVKEYNGSIDLTKSGLQKGFYIEINFE